MKLKRVRRTVFEIKSECLPQHRIRFPFLSKNKETHDRTAAIVTKVAADLNLTPVQVATVMMHAFEGIAQAILKNKVICVPGFGWFGPMTSFRRITRKYTGDGPAAFPAFVPSRVLKHEVRLKVPPAASKEKDRMRNLQRRRGIYCKSTTPDSRDSFLPTFMDWLGRLNAPRNVNMMKIHRPKDV